MGAGGLADKVIEEKLKPEGAIDAAGADNGCVAEQTDDSGAGVRCGASPRSFQLGCEEVVEEDDELLAFGDGPNDSHGASVNLVS